MVAAREEAADAEEAAAQQAVSSVAAAKPAMQQAKGAASPAGETGAVRVSACIWLTCAVLPLSLSL